ncbi:MAG: phosphotransferase [Gammaproteobacteria bacterium]|nr:phosphotransferase [Gammaproteobacteria bacterium]
MEPFESLTPEAQVERIQLLAENALQPFGLSTDSTVVMINHSENTTYRIDDVDSGKSYALRVHRPDYHTKQAIESELAWMGALRVEADVPTPPPVPGRDGQLIQTIAARGIPQPRHCVLFDWMEGTEPDEENLHEPFVWLGEVTAKLHKHAKDWRRPNGFQRQTWDADFMFGEDPIWGPWQEAPGLTQENIRLLQQLETTLRRRLEAFGQSPERFGLVHADLRLANLLIHHGETRVIDFDDCGFSWYLYDLGTALSFIEEREDVSELIDRWLEGYRKVLPVSAEDEAETKTFMMVRRLLLTAWIASHAETDLAKDMGVDYTQGTCRLAERYLTQSG